jgi:hypothetical protein
VGPGILENITGVSAPNPLARPARPDDCQNYCGLPDGIFNVGAKVDTKRDVVDVLEQVFAREMAGEVVEDAISYELAVLPPIANEKLSHVGPFLQTDR